VQNRFSLVWQVYAIDLPLSAQKWRLSLPKDLSANARRSVADGAAFIAIQAAVHSDNFDNPVAVTGRSSDRPSNMFSSFEHNLYSSVLGAVYRQSNKRCRDVDATQS